MKKLLRFMILLVIIGLLAMAYWMQNPQTLQQDHTVPLQSSLNRLIEWTEQNTPEMKAEVLALIDRVKDQIHTHESSLGFINVLEKGDPLQNRSNGNASVDQNVENEQLKEAVQRIVQQLREEKADSLATQVNQVYQSLQAQQSMKDQGLQAPSVDTTSE